MLLKNFVQKMLILQQFCDSQEMAILSPESADRVMDGLISNDLLASR